jgi:hypothetical protein
MIPFYSLMPGPYPRISRINHVGDDLSCSETKKFPIFEDNRVLTAAMAPPGLYHPSKRMYMEPIAHTGIGIGPEWRVEDAQIPSRTSPNSPQNVTDTDLRGIGQVGCVWPTTGLVGGRRCGWGEGRVWLALGA